MVLSDRPLADVPTWTIPVAFGDALANPDSRRWVALVHGSLANLAVFFVRDYALRRVVMARHLVNARSWLHGPLTDGSVVLDFGYDLAHVPGLVVPARSVIASCGVAGGQVADV